MGNANQIGLANANVASPVNVVPVNQFAGGDGNGSKPNYKWYRCSSEFR